MHLKESACSAHLHASRMHLLLSSGIAQCALKHTLVSCLLWVPVAMCSVHSTPMVHGLALYPCRSHQGFGVLGLCAASVRVHEVAQEELAVGCVHAQSLHTPQSGLFISYSSGCAGRQVVVSPFSSSKFTVGAAIVAELRAGCWKCSDQFKLKDTCNSSLAARLISLTRNSRLGWQKQNNEFHSRSLTQLLELR